jgi:hypothetical protein
VVPKLISKSVAGILILLVMGAMLVWQVAPASAGFTPTPPPTVLPTIAPTVLPTIVPTVLPTIVPTLAPTGKPIRPSVTPIATPTATPVLLLPISGGQASDLSYLEISAVSLAGALVLLLAASSLVIRRSSRTKSG